MKYAWPLALVVAQISPTGTLLASPETYRMFGTVLGGSSFKKNG